MNAAGETRSQRRMSQLDMSRNDWTPMRMADRSRQRNMFSKSKCEYRLHIRSAFLMLHLVGWGRGGKFGSHQQEVKKQRGSLGLVLQPDRLFDRNKENPGNVLVFFFKSLQKLIGGNWARLG